jgi:phage-related protein
VKHEEYQITAGHKLESNRTKNVKGYSQETPSGMNEAYVSCNVDLRDTKSVIRGDRV